ncbi:hypothetical protein AVEN_168489-1 [Araneus ventricosus]|uniref:Uncharacterized protein n=1 Tax=Araneus ventricosus TaxID=182803 RepID=A0A4Y2LFP3_ARAVE|nr:hypothetical protein AVEN_168489-1 [Araneus ventricosus]
MEWKEVRLLLCLSCLDWGRELVMGLDPKTRFSELPPGMIWTRTQAVEGTLNKALQELDKMKFGNNYIEIILKRQAERVKIAETTHFQYILLFFLQVDISTLVVLGLTIFYVKLDNSLEIKLNFN